MSSISAPAPTTGISTDTSRLKSKDNLDKAGKQFEAVFLRQMISSMRSAGLGDELFGSSASEQFRDMSDSRLADQMADKGFGVGDLLLRQFMARAQPAEAAPADPAAATKAEGQ